MLYGRARITAVDEEGRQFVDDVGVGDLWYFPKGIPHSIQGLEPDGCEFLLVFDDGSFSEDNTFLLSDWFKHMPPEVLAKNFGVPASNFGNTPDPSELYIFPLPVPGPLANDRVAGAVPVPNTFSHRLMAQEPIRTKGGTRAHRRFQELPGLDHHRGRAGRGRSGRHARAALASRTRTSGSTTSKARAAWACSPSSGDARTFDYQAGDVGFVPFAMGHYIENTGDDAAALPRNVQEQQLRRRLAQSLDGAHPARAGAGHAQARSERHERAAPRAGAGRAGVSGDAECRSWVVVCRGHYQGGVHATERACSRERSRPVKRLSVSMQTS